MSIFAIALNALEGSLTVQFLELIIPDCAQSSILVTYHPTLWTLRLYSNSQDSFQFVTLENRVIGTFN